MLHAIETGTSPTATEKFSTFFRIIDFGFWKIHLKQYILGTDQYEYGDASATSPHTLFHDHLSFELCLHYDKLNKICLFTIVILFFSPCLKGITFCLLCRLRE